MEGYKEMKIGGVTMMIPLEQVPYFEAKIKEVEDKKSLIRKINLSRKYPFLKFNI